MASGDYTTIKRIKEMYKSTNLICNNTTTQTTTTTASSNKYLTINNSNCKLPACQTTCQTTTNNSTLNDCITTDLLSKLFKYEKFISKTTKEYNLVPMRNMGIGILISPNSLLKAGDHVSCYIDTDRLNNFKGIINGYDNVSGFLSLYQIYDINGTFELRSTYSVHLIMCEPDIFKLKERIDMLFKYLFNVDLDINPDYNPAIELISNKENYIYNLFMYLFEMNIRQETGYALNNDYLLSKINELYEYFFNISIIENTTFNPNNNDVIPATLQDYINQIYLYLFNVNIIDYSFYNILG